MDKSDQELIRPADTPAAQKLLSEMIEKDIGAMELALSIGLWEKDRELTRFLILLANHRLGEN